jgi:hypothetical protein
VARNGRKSIVATAHESIERDWTRREEVDTPRDGGRDTQQVAGDDIFSPAREAVAGSRGTTWRSFSASPKS